MARPSNVKPTQHACHLTRARLMHRCALGCSLRHPPHLGEQSTYKQAEHTRLRVKSIYENVYRPGAKSGSTPSLHNNFTSTYKPARKASSSSTSTASHTNSGQQASLPALGAWAWCSGCSAASCGGGGVRDGVEGCQGGVGVPGGLDNPTS